MIIHYLTVSIRQLIKRRTQTLISIVGISAGLLCFSVCSYYSRIMNVGNKDLPTYERMAEIRTVDNSTQAIWETNISPKEFYDKVGTEYYEAMAYFIHSSSRLNLDDDSYVRAKQTECNPDFFKVFPTRSAAGSLHGFDLSQQVAVVTTDFVRKYYANQLPIGKSIQKDNGESYTITAVIEPYPVGMNYYPEACEVFFPLKEGFSFGRHKLLLRNPEDIQRLSQRLVQVNLFPDQPERTSCVLSESQLEEPVGAELWWIAALGLSVLLTSMINFFSFSVGSFANRHKEYSLRNTLGGKPTGLFALLFMEQSIVILLAASLTLAASETLLPWMINALPNEARGELPVDITLLWRYMGQYLVLLLLLSSLVASFSAIYVARQTAMQGMRGGTVSGRRHVVRNILLGCQYFFSLLFIIGIIGVQLQMRAYNHRTNPQMSVEEKNHIIVLNLRGNSHIKNHLEEILTFLRSRRWNDKMAYLSSDYSQRYDFLKIRKVSDEYFDLMKIEKQHQPGEPFCYINPTLQQQMRNDSTPDLLRHNDLLYPVKGVVPLNDGSSSLGSLAFLPFPPQDLVEIIYLRMAQGINPQEAIADLSKEMNKYLPVNEPYEFVTLYDEQTGMVLHVLRGLFVVCSIICLLITILGVYGAISMDTSRRQKEVAIRKINGAKLSGIYWLFGKIYLLLFTVASLLAMGVALFILVMGSRHDVILFSYVHPWLWVIPPALMGAVIACTISWQIYRISRENPAEVIKRE